MFRASHPLWPSDSGLLQQGCCLQQRLVRWSYWTQHLDNWGNLMFRPSGFAVRRAYYSYYCKGPVSGWLERLESEVNARRLILRSHRRRKSSPADLKTCSATASDCNVKSDAVVIGWRMLKSLSAERSTLSIGMWQKHCNDAMGVARSDVLWLG